MSDIGWCRIIAEHLKNAEKENVTITIENLLLYNTRLLNLGNGISNVRGRKNSKCTLLF